MRRFAACAVLAIAIFTRAGGGDWPEFRGPYGNGHAAAPGDARPRGLPLTWSETENVRWKVAIPHRGWSTPVVLGGQVWLTTATADGHDFFALCLDAESGKVLFNQRLFHAERPEPLGNSVNCYASPSPAIEAGRVYIHFGSYGTACLDTATLKVLWERTDLSCRHYRGPGSSVVLFENLVILTFDGVDVQYLTALDKKTGRTVWRTDRTTDFDDLGPDGKPRIEGDFRKAFSTPLIVEAAGKLQMLTPGSKCIYAYDPRTGKELWKVRHTAHTAVLRPVFAPLSPLSLSGRGQGEGKANGKAQPSPTPLPGREGGGGLAIVHTGLGGPQLWAVRMDGEGDVTTSHVAWKVGQDAPKTPSPIVVDDLLYMVSDEGVVTCLEAATGSVVWKQRIGGNYAASPIHADGRLYFCSQQGKTTVLRPGRTFEALATNVLDGGFMASPAVSGRALFLRTRTHLYRIEAASSGAMQ